MAPQFTATKGPSARWLLACKAWATNSLPVPDSPWISTGAMPRDTLATRCLTLRMASDSPTRRSRAALALPNSLAAAALAERLEPLLRAARGGGTPPVPWMAEATTERNCLRSTGLVR